MPVITKEFALNMKGDDEIRDITKKNVRYTFRDRHG